MSRPILLDTCAAIWLAEDQLSEEAVALIGERYADGELMFLSPITAWELGLLFSRGHLRSPVSPSEYFRQLSSLPTMKVTPLSPDILIASSFLPGSAPRDPADRIIIATARDFGLTVMTRDLALLEYAKAGYLHAVKC
jgi:PIN domain nuclease of toxin-antitoxin system